MRLTRRQLRKIINEAILFKEQASRVEMAESRVGQMPPEERKTLINSIDWVRCNLEDGANWNRYTQKTYETSEKTRRSNPQLANEQFIGCITVPLRWTILIETADDLLTKFKINAAGDHDLDKRYDSGDHKAFIHLETDESLISYVEPGYDSFVSYYKQLAQGTKIHAKEFNENFLSNFIESLREALKTSQYRDLASKVDTHESILSEIRRAFIRIEREKTSQYMNCISGNEDLYEPSSY